MMSGTGQSCTYDFMSSDPTYAFAEIFCGYYVKPYFGMVFSKGNEKTSQLRTIQTTKRKHLPLGEQGVKGQIDVRRMQHVHDQSRSNLEVYAAHEEILHLVLVQVLKHNFKILTSLLIYLNRNSSQKITRSLQHFLIDYATENAANTTDFSLMYAGKI